VRVGPLTEAEARSRAAAERYLAEYRERRRRKARAFVAGLALVALAILSIAILYFVAACVMAVLPSSP
jgi:O-antigen/teichoic acid export membrane protein